MSLTGTVQISDLSAIKTTACLDLFSSAQAAGFGDIHFRYDPVSRLKAIIAIHSTRLGRAVGGCRCRPYPSTEAAIEDALRLARGMSYKAALAGLPCGGGKAVLIEPESAYEREAYFEAFGDFVESLGGRYATAVDSGTSTDDMDIVARRTRHVLSVSKHRGGSGDPSPYTAKGVRMSIEAAVRHVFNHGSLDGIHVAIQGAGHVGYALARELHQAGAKLTVTDIHAERARRCAEDFGAQAVSPEFIYGIHCEVFSPCGLGAVINDMTVNLLATRIVAGAANNQLGDERHGQLLHQRGILYLPDFLINSGGLIHVLLNNQEERDAKLLFMIDMLSEILTQSMRSGIPPYRQAGIMAEKILNG